MRVRHVGRVGTGLAALLGAAALAVVPGCGPAKELPNKGGAGGAGPVAQPQPEPTLPTKSEPDARALVDRFLKAATDGHPERVEKAKVSRSKASGQTSIEKRWLAAAVEFQAVWPDRVHTVLSFEDPGLPAVTFGLHRPRAWVRPVPTPGPNPQYLENQILVDTVGRHWLPLLVPLVAPDVVVFGAGKGSVAGDRPVDTVRVRVPDCPVYTLSFDPASGHLLQADYTHSESGVPVRKRATFADHKPVNGVVLPHQITFRQLSDDVMRWTVTAWEFPDKLPDTLFAEP